MRCMRNSIFCLSASDRWGCWMSSLEELNSDTSYRENVVISFYIAELQTYTGTLWRNKRALGFLTPTIILKPIIKSYANPFILASSLYFILKQSFIFVLFLKRTWRHLYYIVPAQNRSSDAHESWIYCTAVYCSYSRKHNPKFHISLKKRNCSHNKNGWQR